MHFSVFIFSANSAKSFSFKALLTSNIPTTAKKKKRHGYMNIKMLFQNKVSLNV